MNQEERDGLLVELLQKEIKRLKVIIGRLEGAGSDLRADIQFMVPVESKNFSTEIHERHIQTWSNVAVEARAALRD